MPGLEIQCSLKVPVSQGLKVCFLSTTVARSSEYVDSTYVGAQDCQKSFTSISSYVPVKQHSGPLVLGKDIKPGDGQSPL